MTGRPTLRATGASETGSHGTRPGMGPGMGPYDRPGYAEAYDAIYNLSEINRPHFDFERATLERLIAERGVRSWLDLACGTGLHLRSVETDRRVKRTGIDRSAEMLCVARRAAADAQTGAAPQDAARGANGHPGRVIALSPRSVGQKPAS